MGCGDGVLCSLFIIGFNTECWLYVLDYGIIWIKVCEEVIHMENVYKGLRHTGLL